MRVFAVTIAMATAVASVRAQQAEAPRPAAASRPGPATTARPRIAYAATPTPDKPTTPVVVAQSPVYYSQGAYVTSGAPYLVLSDGSVSVNFGSGYERVLRPCAAPRSQSSVNSLGRDALGRIPDPVGIAALRPGARVPRWCAPGAASGVLWPV